MCLVLFFLDFSKYYRILHTDNNYDSNYNNNNSNDDDDDNNNDDDIIIIIIIILIITIIIIIIIINQHIDCSPATVCYTKMRDTYLWTTIPIPIKKAQKRN